MDPLVSIHIITYNQRDFIEETLRSALDQDYENLEVVVADDASTDGTADVIKRYASQYPGRLVALLGGQRLGITGNSNRGLSACKGKYIAFQGGDDILLPGKIRKQVTWLEEDERRVLCSHDVEAFDSSTGQTLYFWHDKYRLRAGVGLRDAMRYGTPCLGPGTAIMVRASHIPAGGFDARLPVVSDVKFMFDCLASGGHFGYVDGVYARYRRHERNVTLVDRSSLIRDGELIIDLLEQEHPELKRELASIKSLHFRTLGIWNIQDGRSSTARQFLIECVKHDPRQFWRAAPAYLFTFLPEPLPNRLLLGASNFYRFVKRIAFRLPTVLRNPIRDTKCGKSA